MDLINFKNYLINNYKEYVEFKNTMQSVTKEYLIFLYLHLTDGIKFSITNKREINKNILYKTTVSCNKQYCQVLLVIYHKFLNEDEISVLQKNNNFNVIFYQEDYGKIPSDEYFKEKNRRDFLIPCFLHEKTIEFLNNMNYNPNSNYNDKFKNFHILLGALRKNIRTKDKLGVMICSSFTLNTYNIRRSKDIDLIILHPNYKSNKIRNNLKFKLARKYKFIDPHIHDILEWKDIDKYNMYNINKMNGMDTNNFYDVVFNPKYHYYFFGIKIVDISIDLRYRAIRRYPKNIADLILVKSKINIDIPKIKPIDNETIIEKNKYTKNEFINVILNYLKKFNFKVDYDSLINHISEITYN